ALSQNAILVSKVSCQGKEPRLRRSRSPKFHRTGPLHDCDRTSRSGATLSPPLFLRRSRTACPSAVGTSNRFSLPGKSCSARVTCSLLAGFTHDGLASIPEVPPLSAVSVRLAFAVQDRPRRDEGVARFFPRRMVRGPTPRSKEPRASYAEGLRA